MPQQPKTNYPLRKKTHIVIAHLSKVPKNARKINQYRPKRIDAKVGEKNIVYLIRITLKIHRISIPTKNIMPKNKEKEG